jgi:ABC-type branched-subunit amino acid transport system substrate-binding protein
MPPLVVPSIVAPPPPAKALHEGEVRAALLVPLSGQFRPYGETLSNAAQLALFEMADSHFNLIPLDTKGTAEGAAAAMQQAITQGADIILGPIFSPEVKAAAPLAREQMLPMLAFTTDRTAAGNGVYALGFLPGQQVARVIAFAREQGKTRLAVLARNDEYGHAIADAARDAATAQGVTLVQADYYDPAAQDFTAVIKRFTQFDVRARALAREKAALAAKTDDASKAMLKQMEKVQASGDAAFDAVLIPDDGVRLRNISSLLSYYVTDAGAVKLLGTLLWDDPRLNAEPSLQGGWYPAPPVAGQTAFEQRYAKAFGPMPPRMGLLAGIAYDATALASALAHAGHGGYGTVTLQNPNGFAGVGGIFRLTPDGIAERGLAVRELNAAGVKEVGSAPTSFVGQ